MDWQRSNVQAAATYLRERIAGGSADPRTRAVYEGLLEVLDPARRRMRIQREAASAAKAAVPVPAARERRSTPERRLADRRRVNVGPPGGVERRRSDRRTGRERRSR